MILKKMIELRQLRGWTKVDTAKMLNIHVQRYGRIERYITQPNKIEKQRMKALIEKWDNKRTPEYIQLRTEVIQTITGRMDRKVENWTDLDEDDKDLNSLRNVLGIPRKHK